MTFLYVTGTILTLTRHEWGTWAFGRNVVFNLLGYSFLLHGFRSVWLMTHPETPRPGALDRALLGLLIATVAVMAALAIPRNTPLRIFSVIGIALVVLEVRDWRGGFARAALFARHTRYMLASYFYVLTVVSLVHLRDELPTDGRWLWPTILGVAAIWVASGAPAPSLGTPRAHATRFAIRATIAVALAFGVYVGWEVLRDGISAASPTMSRTVSR
jgi:hypothetical protein